MNLNLTCPSCLTSTSTFTSFCPCKFIMNTNNTIQVLPLSLIRSGSDFNFLFAFHKYNEITNEFDIYIKNNKYNLIPNNIYDLFYHSLNQQFNITSSDDEPISYYPINQAQIILNSIYSIYSKFSLLSSFA